MATQIFIISLITGLFLIGAEIFVPGGILGTIGGILLLVAVINGFVAFENAGPYIALSIVFFSGLALVLWVKWFPRTPVGKAMTVSTDLSTFKGTQSGLEALLGKQGLTVSALRPAGFVVIDGKRVDVVTRGEMISPDRPVKVIEIAGNGVIVAEVPDPAS